MEGMTLGELMALIPLADPALPIEDQSRASLRLLQRSTVALYTWDADPTLCPNCGSECLSTRSPYCSTDCREVSSFVRQFRSNLREETLVERDRQVALGQVLWKLIGGGYPLRNSLIPPRSLARALAANDFKCSACGGVATTVDHIGSACNRTINLKPMCEGCAETRPFLDERVTSRSEVQSRLDELAARICASEPLRACDDAATWDWRDAVEQRKQSR